MKYHYTPQYLKINAWIIILIGVLFISCSKSDPTNTSNTSGTGGTGGGGGNSNPTGTLAMQINWATPQPISGCTTMASVNVEIIGPATNFSQAYNVAPPIRFNQIYPPGSYSYTVIKRPVSGCSNFSDLIKTGSFSITSGAFTTVSIIMD